MNIVISAHFDIARPVMSIKLDDKKLHGLVDNMAGVFTAFQASRQTRTEVFFTNFEELEYDGANDVATKLNKDTIVIVVDTVKGAEAMDKLVTMANFYNLESKELKKQFQDTVHFIDEPFEPTEDETWIYGKRYGFKTFYFGIPIAGEDYHAVNNHILLSSIDKATKVLVETINWLKENYK